MNKKVLHTLEFDKIILQLTEKADSAPGKKRCADLVPDTDLEEIRKAALHTVELLLAFLLLFINLPREWQEFVRAAQFP